MIFGNIYWFTHCVHDGAVLAKRLVDLLQTEKRNWRKRVFYIDENTTVQLIKDVFCYETVEAADTVNHSRLIAEYLYISGNDVVVSLPEYGCLTYAGVGNRTSFSDFQKFHVCNSANIKSLNAFNESDDVFIVNTANDTIDYSFTKIVNHLRSKKINSI